MKNSKIEWTDHTFNPWKGCTKVSKGCANCYAETLSEMNPQVLGEWGPHGTRVLASESMWYQPVKWNKEAAETDVRKKVFCASLADVFEDWKGECKKPNDQFSGMNLNDVRKRLFKLIEDTPNLDWLLLTKRPENILSMMKNFPDNVWIGTSVEDQQTADYRIPHLLKVPAKIRFLSCEPLIGPVKLNGHEIRKAVGLTEYYDWLTGNVTSSSDIFGGAPPAWEDRGDSFLGHYEPRIHWVIVGGESGNNARLFHLDWADSIIQECKDAKVACFVKQLGDNVTCCHSGVNQMKISKMLGSNAKCLQCGFTFPKAPKGSDKSEWPLRLIVQEFPK